MRGPLESTKFFILLALADGPTSGASIRDRIVGDTLGIYLRDSTLYDALASTERAGLIERSQYKVYRLTAKGERTLEQASRTLQRAVQLSQERLRWR